MGVAVPWRDLCDLPPSSRGLVGIIAALHLLQKVGKEAHMRRTLTHLHGRPDEWLDEVLSLIHI
eukprot:8866138-Prorocentrum_lima.AAC.1